jgi:Zn finger protein HypA/HybF involved in hydrogenase expression
MNWFKKFMTGRYGSDQLSYALLAIAILMDVFFRITGLGAISFLVLIPLAFCIYRIFSKNIEKRRMENYKFSILLSPFYSRIKNIMRRLKDSKTHKYFSCPNCKAQLRVPKGKGKVSIRCPKCKTDFSGRT